MRYECMKAQKMKELRKELIDRILMPVDLLDGAINKADDALKKRKMLTQLSRCGCADISSYPYAIPCPQLSDHYQIGRFMEEVKSAVNEMSLPIIEEVAPFEDWLLDKKQIPFMDYVSYRLGFVDSRDNPSCDGGLLSRAKASMRIMNDPVNQRYEKLPNNISPGFRMHIDALDSRLKEYQYNPYIQWVKSKYPGFERIWSLADFYHSEHKVYPSPTVKSSNGAQKRKSGGSSKRPDTAPITDLSSKAARKQLRKAYRKKIEG